MTGAKRQLRATFGLWPLLEARNKTVLARSLPHFRRLESSEVSRLQRGLPRPPSVEVVTVIATYRRADLLRRAVDSALAQTAPNHAVVVVDDGGGELRGLPDDDRLTVVALSRNTGVLGLVRNVGIRLSSSTFVAFLDDDNQWRPDHLEVSLERLRAGADVTYTAVERRLPTGELLDVLSVPYNRRRLRHDGSCVDANSLVVRRAPRVVFSRLPRDRGTFPKEDWEFFRRVSRTRRTEHIPIPTVLYRVNADSYYTNWNL